MRKKHRFGLKLIALALIVVGVVFLLDIRFRPIIEQTAAYQSRILATRLINEAVFSELGDDMADYQQLVNVIYSESGTVTSIESNMIGINRLKTFVTKNVNDELATLEQHDLGVSLGTISGIHTLYGQGPIIPVKAAPEGYVETTMISSFQSAGINQTLHRIIIRIDVSVSAIIPGYTTAVDITSDFVIAETVIVGNVPESYTHVISGGTDLISEINDYNADEYWEG